MPVFQYRAVTASGEVLEGAMDAPTRKGVVERLRDMGYTPLRAVEAGTAEAPASQRRAAGPGLFARGITQDEVGVVTREIATLLKSGLPLDRSLEILVGLAENERVAEMLRRVRNEVRGGASFSKALDAQGGVFSRFYVNMVRAGEAGGAIGDVLGRLAEFMERSKDLRESVKSALIYPTILLLVAVFSVVILLAVVVPQFEPIFEQSGKALPWVTEMVLGAGAFMRAYWSALVILAVAIVFLASRRLRSPEARLAWDRRLLGMPLAGELAAKVETARLARTLGTLLRNGVALVNALSIARETMTNTWMAAGLAEVGRELKTGRGFAKPMMETRRFPAFAVHMIQVGEETGRLHQMLLDVADVYDAEVSRAVKRSLALLEPAMILFLTFVVGGVILSILAAMLSIYDLPL
ncbi:MAG: type II secretion system F family protein [Betaproteobacteria bacterium]|nr:type II secretion system F family protein [Betaproteobacteria bacterium]PWB61727.1 MAG: general secretion pathway protein GspF [Betaproteobacteria bacterium]